MKKIISVLVLAALMLSSIIALIPAAAEDSSYVYEVKYDELEYVAFETDTHKEVDDYHNIINLTCTADLLSAQVKASVGERTLVSTKSYPITADTEYVYYVNAKNNRVGGYTGLIYAMDPGNRAYMLYGALANGGDDDQSKSCLRASFGDFSNELFGAKKEALIKQDLTADGFGQYKFVYTGYKVQVFTMSGGEWVLVKFAGQHDTITLKEGSKIVVGIYNRESGKDNQRTCTITGSKIESTNPEIVRELLTAGYSEAVARALALVPAAYTAESYKVLSDALEASGSLTDTSSFDEIEACIKAINSAIEALVPAKYTVSFDANGGIGAMESVADVNGGEYVIPECTFTAPEGKYFKGWATAADGEVIDGAATLLGDTTFYAIWDLIKYTVTFNRNGGSGKMFDAEDIVGEYTLPEPTYTAPAGKVFKGWATAADGEVVGDTYTVTGDITFYAIWGDPSYVVEFNANGGSGEMASVDTIGVYDLPECSFTAPEGKQFKGWSTTADGATTVDKIAVSADVVIYAIWEDKPVETEVPTEAPTDAPADATEPAKSGCGSFVATSVAVVAVVSVLGTAVVLKKKD